MAGVEAIFCATAGIQLKSNRRQMEKVGGRAAAELGREFECLIGRAKSN